MLTNVSDKAINNESMNIYRICCTKNASIIENNLIIQNKLVFDADETTEIWVFGDLKLIHVGKIWMDNPKNFYFKRKYIYNDPFWGKEYFVDNISYKSKRLL